MRISVEKSIFVGVLALVAAYVVARAILLPLTHDEASTMFNHLPRLAIDLIFYQRDSNPNNHILNTLGAKICAGIFGWHQLVVRTPVLIGCFFYLWATFHLVQKISTQFWVRLFALLLLVGNPYLLEFFGLARGYGLAIGLMLMAIWRMVQFMENNQAKTLRNAFIFAGMAVYANFTLILFFAPFAALALAAAWQRNPGLRPFWASARPALITLGIFAALWYFPLIRLSKEREIVIWANVGSFMDTVKMLMRSTTRAHAYLGDDTTDILSWAAVIFIFISIIFAVIVWKRNRWQFAGDPRVWFGALLLSVIVANYLQVSISHTPFLQARLAQFYYPLFALQLAVVTAWLWEYYRRKTLIFVVPVFTLLLLNNIRCLNLRDSYEWWFDSGTFVVLDYIKSVYEQEGHNEPYKLDTGRGPINSLSYHIEKAPSGYDKFAKITRYTGDKENRDSDFFYATSNEDSQMMSDKYEIVLDVPNTDFHLFRRKKGSW